VGGVTDFPSGFPSDTPPPEAPVPPSVPPPGYPSAPPPPPPSMTPPPGYVPYQAGRRAAQPAARIRGLTRWLVGLAGLSLAVNAAALLVQLTLRGTAQDFLDDVISANEFEDAIVLSGVMGMLTVAVTIATLVVQCIWTWRLAKNMEGSLFRQPQSLSSPGATIAINILGGCTLGILPYLMWREIWLGSDPERAVGDPSWKRGSISPLLHVYLAGTLISVVASFATGLDTLALGAGSLKTRAEQISAPEGLIGGLAGLVSGIALLLFFRQLARRHMTATGETI
jgi:hypothetical protein